jgi:hypothetical protein
MRSHENSSSDSNDFNVPTRAVVLQRLDSHPNAKGRGDDWHPDDDNGADDSSGQPSAPASAGLLLGGSGKDSQPSDTAPASAGSGILIKLKAKAILEVFEGCMKKHYDLDKPLPIDADVLLHFAELCQAFADSLNKFTDRSLSDMCVRRAFFFPFEDHFTHAVAILACGTNLTMSAFDQYDFDLLALKMPKPGVIFDLVPAQPVDEQQQGPESALVCAVAEVIAGCLKIFTPRLFFALENVPNVMNKSEERSVQVVIKNANVNLKWSIYLEPSDTVEELCDRISKHLKLDEDDYRLFHNRKEVGLYDRLYEISSATAIVMDIVPRVRGGGKRGAAPASAGEREGKMTRAEMLNKYEDDFKLSVLRLQEGTQDSFFNNLVAKLTKMKDESADVTASKTAMSNLLRKMPVENLRHINEVLKAKKLHLTTAACYKGVFAAELEKISKVETDLKYAKMAMDTGEGLVFIRQFHKGTFNWDEINEEVMDAMQDVIKGSTAPVSAGSGTDNAQVQRMTD